MTNHKLEVGNWVTAPGFKPSRIVYSQNSQTHYVIFESLVANASGKREIVKLRNPSFENLKRECLRRFSGTVFSITNPNPELSVTSVDQAKDNWQAEKNAILEKAATEHANQQQLESMSDEEKWQIINENILQMMRENVWLSNNPTFFTWQNSENYQVLLAYFAAMKWGLPSVERCGHAFRWLWDANYLHKQEAYRRSEEHLKPRRFDANMLQSTTTITPAQLAAAKKKLLIFNGRRITNEMALSVISQAEIDAINQESGSAHARSTEDLTAEVKANRSVRSRAQLASDSQYF